MNTLDIAHQQLTKAPIPRSAQFVLGLLSRLTVGHLVVRLPSGEVRNFGDAKAELNSSAAPCAMIHMNNWNLCSAALKSGDIGFAETYISEDWTTDSLIDVLNVLVANRSVLENAVYGSWLGRLAYRFKHLLNRNSKANARKNIHAHYDIGNAFYKLWLDHSMTYSSAIFAGDTSQSLSSAQAAKYQRVMQELNAKSGDSLLEIGCGWGGFAQTAALAGATVKGLTLSTEQLEFARNRLDKLPSGGALAQFALQDYRDENGQYDGIASIEMFEAVGEEFWPSYFETLARNLKPGAKAVVQTITIANELFERYRKSTDFIQQYIFPGGMLPCPSVFESMAQKHGLKVVTRYSFGLDYAETLARWRTQFMAQLPAVKNQGFDTPFIRTWEFYLAYCEAAFLHKNTDVMQYTLQRQAR